MKIQLFGNEALITSVAAELYTCGLHVLISAAFRVHKYLTFK